MDLYSLARTILLVNRRPISKIRLGRVIYFTHKELIRKKLMHFEDIAYFRSPLGPTPDGLANLAQTQHIVSQRNQSSNLSYTNEEFTLGEHPEQEEQMLEQYQDVLKSIERTLTALSNYSTPELVEASHHEPSWQAHLNGQSYFITPADLKVTFPFLSSLRPLRIKIRFHAKPLPNKSGIMQANLLRGMIRDIVKESTDLEYPNEEGNKEDDTSAPNDATPTKTPPSPSKTTPNTPEVP